VHRGKEPMAKLLWDSKIEGWKEWTRSDHNICEVVLRVGELGGENGVTDLTEEMV